MPTVPRILKNFNLFVAGNSYLGKISKLTLPELKIKSEEFHPGGYDGAITADMGTEVLTSTFGLYDYDAEIFGLFGLSDPGSVRLSARGALQRDNERPVAIIANMQGSMTRINTGDWSAGTLNESEYEMSLRYYQLEIDGKIAIEIDIVNCIRIVNGVDQLAGLRAAMGV